MSPQRPRSAQLPALSLQALRKWVPEHWIVRNQPEEDIGIDAEVEVMDDKPPHESTGTLFKVQLKGTDEEDLSRALAVELDVRHFDYYTNRLNLPTLIARYHAPSKRLYARWAHRFGVCPRPGQKTITLRLTPDDLVEDSSPAAWLEDMVVTVNPRRIEIRPVPWAGPNWSAEYGVTFRNTSERVLYDVQFDVMLEKDSPLNLSRLHLEPQGFPIDPSFGMSPIALGGVYTESGRPFLIHQIARMEPRSVYPFRVTYQPEPGDLDRPGTLEFRVTLFRSEPSPLMTFS